VLGKAEIHGPQGGAMDRQGGGLNGWMGGMLGVICRYTRCTGGRWAVGGEEAAAEDNEVDCHGGRKQRPARAGR
jgi:hypothetical protein